MKTLLLTAAFILLAIPAMAKDYTVKMVTDDDKEDSHRFDPDRLALFCIDVESPACQALRPSPTT